MIHSVLSSTRSFTDAGRPAFPHLQSPFISQLKVTFLASDQLHGYSF